MSGGPRVSTGAKSVQEVKTPAEFLAAVRWRFGEFSWDLAADETNHVTPKWFGPGSTQNTDSFAHCWMGLPGGLMWLTPPFRKIAPWAAKCAEVASEAMGRRIALLVPAAVGSNWFAKYVDKQALVLFLSPRLNFNGDPFIGTNIASDRFSRTARELRSRSRS